MPENSPVPPQKPRGLMLIMMSLLGILVLTLMMYNHLVPRDPSWSQFLDKIRSGEVVEIQRGHEDAQVREGKNSNNLTYHVLYPGGVLSDSDRKTLNDLTEERDAQAKRDEINGKSNPVTPINISGLPNPGLLQ